MWGPRAATLQLYLCVLQPRVGSAASPTFPPAVQLLPANIRQVQITNHSSRKELSISRCSLSNALKIATELIGGGRARGGGGKGRMSKQTRGVARPRHSAWPEELDVSCSPAWLCAVLRAPCSPQGMEGAWSIAARGPLSRGWSSMTCTRTLCALHAVAHRRCWGWRRRLTALVMRSPCPCSHLTWGGGAGNALWHIQGSRFASPPLGKN